MGPNGIGKTNILEAIHFFANTRSFRYVSDLNSLIKEEKKESFVSGEFDNFSVDYKLTADKRLYFFNKTPAKGIYEILDFVSVVSYAPTFYDLVNTANSFRLSYLDKIAFILDKSYLIILQKYKKILKERNRLLKKQKPVKAWNPLLVKYGSILIEKRELAIVEINKQLSGLLKDISFHQNISLLYKQNTKNNFAETLFKNETKDYMFGHTSVGPHRDQLDFIIESKTLRGVFSTGESKILTFLLKLVEAILSKDKFDETIFIYDDAGAFLDKKNFEMVINMLNSLHIQILMSSVNKKLVACSNLSDSISINLKS